jgi:hypothetical protein
MDIYYLRKFWFGERYFTDTVVHPNYFTVDIPEANIDAQIWLTILSPGVNLDERVTGLAAAGVKSFRFIDPEGLPRFQEVSDWQSHVRVERCTAITFAFHVRLAWAKAKGMIYYWTH